MEFQGRISKIFPVLKGKSAAGNDWMKQDFIFEYFERENDRWSDKVLLSVMNERITEYQLHEGEEVKCGFSHSVREYNGKYYNEVRLYRLQKVVKEQPQATSEQPTQTQASEPTLPF